MLVWLYAAAAISPAFRGKEGGAPAKAAKILPHLQFLRTGVFPGKQGGALHPDRSFQVFHHRQSLNAKKKAELNSLWKVISVPDW